ncbi:chitin deacetylase [Podila epigama]|nr:chitin deacetylase [Podila epigama]
MAPIARLTAVALLFTSLLVQASPIPAPVLAPTSPDAAFSTNGAYASSSPVLERRAAPAAQIYTQCVKPGQIAITFDDGVSVYTNELLDKLKKAGVKATFFINGENNGSITKYTNVVKRMYDEGHQIASHTWSHKDLTTLTNAQRDSEMKKLDDAVKKIIGKRPVFMRPPYGATNSEALAYLGAKGYKVVNWNLDTNDWQHPDNVAKSLAEYTKVLKKSNAAKKTSFIALQHDTNEKTAKEVGPKAVAEAKKYGFKVVTVGECLGVAKSGWYRK